MGLGQTTELQAPVMGLTPMPGGVPYEHRAIFTGGDVSIDEGTGISGIVGYPASYCHLVLTFPEVPGVGLREVRVEADGSIRVDGIKTTDAAAIGDALLVWAQNMAVQSQAEVLVPGGRCENCRRARVAEPHSTCKTPSWHTGTGGV